MGAASAGVFISYRRNDAEEEAKYLSSTLGLRVGQDRVFVDTASLAPGDAWLDRLHQAVDACAVLLVLIGPDWNPASEIEARGRLFEAADVVRAEVTRGLAGGQRVIPILVRGAVMPQVEDLPPDLKTLPGRQAVVVEDGMWTYEAGHLTAVVERVIGSVVRAPDAGLDTSSLIGRDDLLAEVVAALAGIRLLTLTGAGGCGKTRIAAAVASRVDAGTRSAFVDLTSVRQPAYVPRAIADAVGATEADEDEELLAAARLLRDRERALLVIDNCEHLLDACADAAARLLGEVPGLRVLATSREPLALAGERVMLVPPLALPDLEADAEAAGSSGAVRLFLERARSAVPTFSLDDRTTTAVVSICQRLDGLPLAIELAASRLRAMDIVDLAQRLSERIDLLSQISRDGDARHRTMSQAIDWSYGLLEPDEAHLFDRLWIFDGGFDLDDAEVVCGDPDLDVVTALPSLVERSLVVMDRGPDGGRYRLLEPIRQYASTHVGAHVDAIARRHAEHFTALTEAAEPQIRGPEQNRWRRRLRREAPNLRSAAEWAAANDPELFGRMMSATWWSWPGSNAEARRLVVSAIALRGRMSDATRLSVMASGVEAALFQGDYPEGVDLAEEVIAAGATGQALQLALLCGGSSLRELGRFDKARACHERAEREGADPWFVARAIYSLGLVANASGDLDRAAGAFEASRTKFEELGDRNSALESTVMLAIAAFRNDEAERARDLCLRASELTESETSSDGLAYIRLVESDSLRAVGTRAGAAEACWQAFQLMWNCGYFAGLPSVLDRAAGIAVDDGKPELALMLLAASGQRRLAPGILESIEAAGLDLFPADVAVIRDAAVAVLSSDEERSAWQRGLDTTIDDLPQLIGEALGG